MAVTKRTRFEVLRRDNHTCQYCGGKAPDVVLQIDHVVPVALGGDDKPGNLVTACKECNAGKTSIPMDAPIVQGLSDRAAAYALGMVDKMTRLRADVERADEYIEEFDSLWGSWHLVGSEEPVPLPPDYQLSLFRWCQMGIPMRLIEMAIPKAMTKPGVRGEFGAFTYMAGIVWNMFESREIDTTVTADTAAVYTEAEVEEERVEAYQTGYWKGVKQGRLAMASIFESRDLLAHHVDNTYMVVEEDPFGDGKIMTGGVRRHAA